MKVLFNIKKDLREETQSYSILSDNVQEFDKTDNPSTSLGQVGSYYSKGRVYFRRIPKYFGIKYIGSQLKSVITDIGSEKREGSAIARLFFSYRKKANAKVFVVNKETKEFNVFDSEFDSDGLMSIDMISDKPARYKVIVTTFPKLPENILYTHRRVINAIPNLIGLDLTFWHIEVKSRNLTDNWLRWQIRSVYRHPLPGCPWHHELGYVGYVIGLAGYLTWRELVPVVSSHPVYYEFGNSAWCNTPEPYPPREKCCEYRKNTWWEEELRARKSVTEEWTKIASDKLNISFHYIVKLTDSDASPVGKCVTSPDKKCDVRCGWENGPDCGEMVKG